MDDSGVVESMHGMDGSVQAPVDEWPLVYVRGQRHVSYFIA